MASSKLVASNEQLLVCNMHDARPMPVAPDSKVGIARNVRLGLQPLNGLRHPPEGDSNGWYLWSGAELSQEPDFFVPLHVKHVHEWCPAALRYLSLPPGWRFLIAPGHEDVWFDASLLEV